MIPKLRWFVRREMEFDSNGEAIGYANVRVLQYAVEVVEQPTQRGFQVYRLDWHDIPVVYEA